MAAPKKKSSVTKSTASKRVKSKLPKKTAKAVTKVKALTRVKAATKVKAKSKLKALAKPVAPKRSIPAPAVRTPSAFPKALIATVKALDEKKAEQIRVIELGPLSSVADYFVLATGNSEPHLRSLRIELDRALEEAGSRVRGIEAQRDSGWTVVDSFEIVFHLFRPEQRAAFRLETLWKDGINIPVSSLLKA
jgi:ribosome-associated protein